MRILGYRFNSAAELRLKLRAKNFDKTLIDETIDRLRTEKWLDDERFNSLPSRRQTGSLPPVADTRFRSGPSLPSAKKA